MQFVFEVTVNAERDEGKFASRDELQELIQSELEQADPGSLEPGENSYSIDWQVDYVGDGSAPSKKAQIQAHLEALARLWGMS